MADELAQAADTAVDTFEAGLSPETVPVYRSICDALKIIDEGSDAVRIRTASDQLRQSLQTLADDPFRIANEMNGSRILLGMKRSTVLAFIHALPDDYPVGGLDYLRAGAVARRVDMLSEPELDLTSLEAEFSASAETLDAYAQAYGTPMPKFDAAKLAEDIANADGVQLDRILAGDPVRIVAAFGIRGWLKHAILSNNT